MFSYSVKETARLGKKERRNGPGWFGTASSPAPCQQGWNGLTTGAPGKQLPLFLKFRRGATPELLEDSSTRRIGEHSYLYLFYYASWRAEDH